MNLIKRTSLVFSLLAICALPALGSVTINAPANGSKVSPQFTLSAAATTCSNQKVGSMGFSLDSSSNTTMVKGTSISAAVTAAAGAHTLHVKAWGTSGAVCVADAAITVTAQSTTTAPAPTPAPAPASTTSGVSVSAPLNNATVGSPFALDAAAATCSSQTVTSIGYSLDNSSSTAIVKSTSVAASVTASAGAHTVHIKAWGSSGAVCVANVAFTVASSASAATLPSGGVTISSPAAGASVTSPFTVVASASTCSSQAVTSIGYAVDGNSSTIATGASLNTQISAAAGTHTVHVTAWGNGGASCTASVAIDVTDPGSPTSSLVPSNATSVSSIQALSSWQTQNDPATGGSSTGTTALASSPSVSGNARRFNTSFTGSSGEIYHVAYGDDANATNFFYDAWVYLANSASNIANLEMDMNQVTSNGQTVIYGFQCDGYSGTWDYTKNAGTPSKPSDQWVHSSAACNVRNWSVNAWHHIQISYSRDDSGKVTYHSVWLDGSESQIEATVPSSFALGWGQVLLTNFQVDGLGSGSNTVYLDKLTISRW